jgi:hypothetical protein
MFDRTGFSVWKYHMEIVFEAKGLLSIVQGSEKQPTFPASIANNRSLDEAEQTKLDEWKRRNAKARMIISKSISQKILGKLTGSLTAAAM